MTFSTDPRAAGHPGEIRNLPAADSNHRLLPPAKRLAKLESSIGLVDQRLTAISAQLEAIKASVIDPEDVAAALAEFEPVWEVLQPNERTRIIQLLIESAEYDSRSGGLTLEFRVGCVLPIAGSDEGY